MSNLFVPDGSGLEGKTPTIDLRRATREDVLTAVRELGGVEIKWCDTHGQRGNFYAGCYHRAGCVTKLTLIIPLDTGDPE
jgi:hypothetical protein